MNSAVEVRSVKVKPVSDRVLDPNWRIDEYGEIYYAKPVLIVRKVLINEEEQYVIELWSKKAQDWLKSQNPFDWSCDRYMGQYTVNSKTLTWLMMNNWE